MPQLRVGEDRFDADLNKLLNVELIAIQKLTGMSARTFGERLGEGDVLAMTAFVWVHRKRHDPTLQFDDVVFAMSDIESIEDPRPVLADDPEPVGPGDPGPKGAASS